nr:MAG TPA: hypothetical protein [Caudoviricetes sp.]
MRTIDSFPLHFRKPWVFFLVKSENSSHVPNKTVTTDRNKT